MRAWHDGAGKAWKDAKDAKDADMIWFDVGWDGLRVENISWRGHSCWEKPPPARQPAGCGQIYTVKATVKPFGHEQCHRFECTVFSLMLPAPTGRWCRKKNCLTSAMSVISWVRMVSVWWLWFPTTRLWHRFIGCVLQSILERIKQHQTLHSYALCQTCINFFCRYNKCKHTILHHDSSWFIISKNTQKSQSLYQSFKKTARNSWFFPGFPMVFQGIPVPWGTFFQETPVFPWMFPDVPWIQWLHQKSTKKAIQLAEARLEHRDPGTRQARRVRWVVGRLSSGKPTKNLWKTTIFHGKIHYFNGHFQ